MTIQIGIETATELREEAASARFLSATRLNDAAIIDLLEYAAALDAELRDLDQIGFAGTYH